MSFGRCSMCPNTHRQVGPDGPRNARIMLIGEGPGAHEDRTGIPFYGPSGDELNDTYLKLARLDRSDIYVTNCVQCRCERGGFDVKPAQALIDCCTRNHLHEEISDVSPAIIILAGAAACSLAPDVDLELDHGRIFSVRDVPGLGGWSGQILPVYHPAAGMRDGRYMIYSLEDFEKFGLWLKGKLQYPVDRASAPHYQLIRPGQFWKAFDGLPEHYEYLPLDTESDEGRIWSIQFSPAPGTGYMIRTDDLRSVEDFACWLAWSYDSKVLMHNAIHDLDELDQLGITVKAHRDTQQELYHLGNLPQGLKAAVYRTLGHKMISYKETVVPRSRAVLEGWLCEALVWATEHRETEPHPQGKDCLTCGKRHQKDMSKSIPHVSEAVLRRIMNKLSEESAYDPWQKPKLDHGVEKPRLIGRDWLATIEADLSRMPRQSIVHVPIDEAVKYGCSDADWTGRLGTWLEQERVRIVGQEWRVAA